MAASTLKWLHNALAYSDIVGPFNAGATSCTVDKGAVFPSPGTGQVFLGLVWNRTDYPDSPLDDEEREFVLVGGRSGNTLSSITRGREGTLDRSHSTSGKTFAIAVALGSEFFYALPQLKANASADYVFPAAGTGSTAQLESVDGSTDPLLTIRDDNGGIQWQVGIDVSAAAFEIGYGSGLGTGPRIKITTGGAVAFNSNSQIGVMHVYGSSTPTIALNQSQSNGKAKLGLYLQGTERGFLEHDASGASPVLRLDSDYEINIQPNNTLCQKMTTNFDTVFRAEDDAPDDASFWNSTSVHGSFSFWIDTTGPTLKVKVKMPDGTYKSGSIALA